MFFANDVDADYDAVIKGTLVDRERRWRDSLEFIARMKRFAVSPGIVAVIVLFHRPNRSLHTDHKSTIRRCCASFPGAEGIRFVNLIERLAPA